MTAVIPDIDIRPATDVLDAINDQMRRTPGLMQTAVQRQLRNTRRRILPTLRALEPGPPRYPLRWKSDRQHRFVMAKLRREGNLPYQRTGDLLRRYDLTLTSSDAGGVFTLTNDAPQAPFVIGNAQQPYHIDTGWEFIGVTANRVQDTVTEDLIETWFTVSDPFAGVPL